MPVHFMWYYWLYANNKSTEWQKQKIVIILNDFI